MTRGTRSVAALSRCFRLPPDGGALGPGLTLPRKCVLGAPEATSGVAMAGLPVRDPAVDRSLRSVFGERNLVAPPVREGCPLRSPAGAGVGAGVRFPRCPLTRQPGVLVGKQSPPPPTWAPRYWRFSAVWFRELDPSVCRLCFPLHDSQLFFRRKGAWKQSAPVPCCFS